MGLISPVGEVGGDPPLLSLCSEEFDIGGEGLVLLLGLLGDLAGLLLPSSLDGGENGLWTMGEEDSLMVRSVGVMVTRLLLLEPLLLLFPAPTMESMENPSFAPPPLPAADLLLALTIAAEEGARMDMVSAARVISLDIEIL